MQKLDSVTLDVPRTIPPKYKIIKMDDWNLKDLKTTFVIPDYQRRLDMTTVNKIVKAVLANTFYDIVIWGSQRIDGKINVVNFQHRREAFIILNEKHGLKKYSFILILIEGDERLIYRVLNLGKKFIASDHTKVLDDGKHQFFIELKLYLKHYRNLQTLSYVDMLYAHKYALSTNPDGSISLIDTLLKSLTESDIKLMKVFLQAMTESAGSSYKNILYKGQFFRNIYRIGHEQKFNLDQFKSLIKFLKSHRKLLSLEKGRGSLYYDAVYELIKTEWRK